MTMTMTIDFNTQAAVVSESDIKYHLLREEVKKGTISMYHTRTENDFLHETSLDYLKKSPLRAKLCPPLMNYVILKNQLYQSKYCWLTENG